MRIVRCYRMTHVPSLLVLLLVLLTRTDPVAPLVINPTAKALRNGNYNKRGCIQPVRIVSWNVLAPCYSPKEKYPWSPPEFLSWSHRESAILSEMKRMNADIYCLQEIQVSPDLWPEFLEKLQMLSLSSSSEIRRPDYVGVIQNVTRGHPIANAIIFRRDKFRILRQESRSRALIVVLERKQNDYISYNNKQTQCPLYLANVHLQAGRDSDQTRVYQLRSLMKQLFKHARMDGGNKIPPAVVIAGDFNILPTNPVYRWLARGTNREDNLTEYYYGTDLDLAFPKKVPLLPLYDALAHNPPVGITNTPATISTAQFLEMTFCGGGVLDYLWAPCSSKTSLRVLQTMIFHPFAFQRQAQELPSEECPSDHLPIGADITW